VYSVTQYSISGRSGTAISASVEEGIRAGHLSPGATLPTVRGLAARLGVSPTTVAGAYRDLRGRGLLVGDGRRGTRVSGRPPVALPGWGAQGGEVTEPGLRDLSAGSPDPALLPDLGPALSVITGPARAYGEARDDDELLDLARRQFEADGIAGTAIAIVGGAMDGIERVLDAHLAPGDRVAVEDPGYTAVLDLVGALRLLPIACRVDDEGLIPGSLEEALRAGARAVVLTPRAQNPMGAALSRARGRDLRAVLARHRAVLVIEDDHAGPVAGPAGGPAAGVFVGQAQEHWVVVRSVSKWLGPDLRLAFVAGDDTTVARVEGRRALGAGWVSHILQRAVASLWREATVGAAPLLGRAAAAYRERREAMLGALSAYGIPAHGRSGLNVWVPVREEVATAQRLREAGYLVRAGERYRMRSGPAIRVTVAALPAGEADEVAAAIAAAVTAPRRRTLPA
jgi:DNA-binding transcriptional MocR family regulator